MEIHGKLPPVYAKQIVSPGPAADKAAVEHARPVGQADQVVLSARARKMQAAHEAVTRMPDVDLDKVARIKAQVQKGTYSVDGEQTAARMLAESLLDTP
jgi:negative regulator of flagellin synthesis FlgM